MHIPRITCVGGIALRGCARTVDVAVRVTFPLFYPATAQAPVPATAENKRRLIQWIGQAQADGSSYPKTALFTALAMKPDVIFVLSDGKFPDGPSRDRAVTAQRAGLFRSTTVAR